MIRQGSDGPAPETAKPLLMVDIDGVISLFGVAPSLGGETPGADGCFHSIDGIPHFLSATAAAHLLALSEHFELVWASGWEEKANEYLPHLLGLPELPFLRFPAGVQGTRRTVGHWKLDTIDEYAAGRPLAWVDDALGPACHEWAAARTAPTLLVETVPERGLTSREALLLEGWAKERPAAPQAAG
ncbi:MAG TPA: HAD domain-containing protein [Solirubrobacteraceae bacterium]